MTSVNLRITAKPLAYLQSLKKTHVKFKKDASKVVGIVAFTRLDAVCDKRSDIDRQIDTHRGKTKCFWALMEVGEEGEYIIGRKKHSVTLKREMEIYSNMCTFCAPLKFNFKVAV